MPKLTSKLKSILYDETFIIIDEYINNITNNKLFWAYYFTFIDWPYNELVKPEEYQVFDCSSTTNIYVIISTQKDIDVDVFIDLENLKDKLKVIGFTNLNIDINLVYINWGRIVKQTTNKDITKILQFTEIYKTLIKFIENSHFSLGELIKHFTGDKQLETVKQFIKKGLTVNDLLDHFMTNDECLEVIKYLVDQGADLHYDDGMVLVGAAECGQFEIVKYLVEQGIIKECWLARKMAYEFDRIEIGKYLDRIILEKNIE